MDVSVSKAHHVNVDTSLHDEQHDAALVSVEPSWPGFLTSLGPAGMMSTNLHLLLLSQARPGFDELCLYWNWQLGLQDQALKL